MPLRGVRVLDLTRLLPGPYATQVLGDFGADVIKVEDTGAGDPTRLMPPFVGNESARYLALGRNKRSIALNLKIPSARKAFQRIALGVDVLVEGFRPGVMERLGLGWEALRALNPVLVYCSITGYGRDGALRERAAHDINYLAEAGVLAITGEPDGPPVVPGVQVADLFAAQNAVIGILLALRARKRTGRGQLVDVALSDAALSLLSIHAAAELAGEPQRRGEGVLSGARPCYGLYETSDGRWLSLGALEPKFWEAFCGAIGRPDLAARQLVEGREAAEVRAEVETIILGKTLAEWERVFAHVDACVAPVLEVGEALRHPQHESRRMLRAMPHPSLGLVHQLGPAIRLSETTEDELRLPPPALGEHTDEVLRDAGYGPAEIAALRAEGAIAGPVAAI
jgi:crotonobetainyl-CoA:carnitine CoA-transferase CaiB-like acyl-CoA transferase